jgi:hypothetical protein
LTSGNWQATSHAAIRISTAIGIAPQTDNPMKAAFLSPSSLRVLSCALIGVAAALVPAEAEIDYIGNIALPDNHDNFIRFSTSAAYEVPDSNGLTVFMTLGSIYYLTTDHTTNTASFFPLAITLPTDLRLTSSSIAVNYNRGMGGTGSFPSPADQFILYSASRNGLVNYDFDTRDYLDAYPMNSVSTSQRNAMAANGHYAVIASNNQLWTSPMNATARDYNAGASPDPVPWPLLPTGATSGVNYLSAEGPAVFTNIATVSTDPATLQFTNLTEMAFAPASQGGLLFTLDWGAQRISAFDISDPTGNYFRYSFDIPVDLTLTNTTGQGFAINDAGHMFLSNGQGGGIELSLTGDLLDTFTPPPGDLLGVNVNPAVDGTTNTGDTLIHYITFSQAGDVFVMDGSNGMHWYRDLTPVPEPATYALGTVTLLGGAILLRRRKSLRV